MYSVKTYLDFWREGALKMHCFKYLFFAENHVFAFTMYENTTVTTVFKRFFTETNHSFIINYKRLSKRAAF